MKNLRDLVRGILGKAPMPEPETDPNVPKPAPKKVLAPAPEYPLKTWDAVRKELIRLELIGKFERHMSEYESRNKPHPDWYLVLKGGYVWYFHPKWSQEAEHWIKTHGIKMTDTVFYHFNPPEDS